MKFGDKALTKKRKIEERLKRVGERLRNAEEYIARNVNVESTSFVHIKDWEGKSGHPLWMKNFMVPRTKIARTQNEKALERIVAKEKDKKSQERRKSRRK